MNHALNILIALLICCIPNLAFCAPAIYPVKELFGFDAPALTNKAPFFSKWVTTRGKNNNESLTKLANEFDSAFRKEFGQLAANDITDVNKHEVLVASLHLIRASQYVVPKMGNYEVHMPITLSIVITNPSTGEVLYSFTKTSYATALLANPNLDAQSDMVLYEQTVSNYQSLLQALIRDAKNGYNPEKIEVTVQKIWNGLYILDKGGKFGIAKDDSMVDAASNEISIKYVTEDYAVASSLLGKVNQGQKFFKYATASTANQFNKPRVLTMHDGWKDPLLTDVSRFFDSEVSKESAFTLLPVNEYFRKLLAAIARDTYAGKYETTQQRAIPDFILKFSATAPRAYTMTESGKFSVNAYEQYVLGELLDKQGRILFSAVGTDRIEDKNVDGMVFDKQARLEVLLKNSVVNLAEKFASSIKFSHYLHPVTNVSGNSVEIEDKSRELRIGQGVTLFRNIGSVEGISTDVIIPTWQASVVEADQGKVKLDLLLPMFNKGIAVSNSDMVIVDALSANSTGEKSETSVSYCTKPESKLGNLNLDDFSVISRASGYLLPYTLYDHDKAFSQIVHAAVRDGGFKDTFMLGKVDTAGRCLLPVYKANFAQNNCDQGFCTSEIAFIAGYRLYTGQDIKGKAGSKTIIKTENCGQTYQIAFIQGEMSKTALSILKEKIVTVHYK